MYTHAHIHTYTHTHLHTPIQTKSYVHACACTQSYLLFSFVGARMRGWRNTVRRILHGRCQYWDHTNPPHPTPSRIY